MMSPGTRVIPCERKETSSATEKIIFDVVPSCITSSFRMHLMERSCGSSISSQVARGDVVGVRVTEDVIEGLGLGDVACCPPDNDRQLSLIVGLLGYGGYPYGLSRPYNRAGVLGEDDGLLRDICPCLGRVVLVVEANADDLLGPPYRGVEARLPERHRVFPGFRTPAVLDELDHVLVGERPYLFSLKRPDTRLSTIHRIHDKFQGLSSP